MPKKTALAFLFSFALLTSPAASRAARIELVYGGDLVQKTDTRTAGGVEYVPLKPVAALFRGKTQWFPVAGQVVFQLNNQKITFNMDSRTAVIAGKKTPLGAPARMIQGTIYVPVEFFTKEAFEEIADCEVRWDPAGPALVAEPNASLLAPRIYTRPERTRVVLESKEPIAPEVKKKANVVTVELPKAKIAEDEIQRVKDRIVESVSLSQARRGATLRVALASDMTSYRWALAEDPDRLILEFDNPRAPADAPAELWPEPAPPEAAPAISTRTAAPEAASPSVKISPPAPVPVPAPPHAPKPRATAPSPARVKKIVVDAGHGGKDAGAIGRKGTKEKDINLMIALELARVLRIEGYEVYLTRNDDTFVSLIDRTLFANEKRADLFISIHCNASLRKTQGGFEVYFLADDATDQHAEATEELENSVIELEGPQSAKKQKLQELLFSMAKNEFINESSLLCHEIAKAIAKRSPIENRGVKQADFHVLHGAQMPAVLIETAFITHAQEEQKLRQRKFRSSVVDAALAGIENYEKHLARLR